MRARVRVKVKALDQPPHLARSDRAELEAVPAVREGRGAVTVLRGHLVRVRVRVRVRGRVWVGVRVRVRGRGRGRGRVRGRGRLRS